MSENTLVILSPTAKRPVNVIFDHNWQGMRYITTCTVFANGGKILSGSAICSPRDALNVELGQRIAFKRAITDGMNRENVPAHIRKEMLRAWRKALWEARHPEGWKPAEAEIPALVTEDSNIPY